MIDKTLVIATALMFTVNGEGTAQIAGPRDLLSFPGKHLRCQRVPISARDSSQGVQSALRFVEGDNIRNQRVIDVGYSAAGSPFYLVVMANVPSPGRPFSTNSILVRFGPNGKAAGLRMRPDTTEKNVRPTRSDSIAAIASVLADLSAAENSQARELATRLWSSRCGVRHPPPRH